VATRVYGTVALFSYAEPPQPKRQRGSDEVKISLFLRFSGRYIHIFPAQRLRGMPHIAILSGDSMLGEKRHEGALHPLIRGGTYRYLHRYMLRKENVGY
jgi:hypothetical protein